MRVRPVLLSAALLFVPSSVTGQSPPQLGQDELDLQARANVVQGSGARALGMGGAFLARADDATAASWNPAGLSYLRLPEVSFVYSGSRLDSLETNTASRKDDRRHGRTPDFFAAAYPFDLGRVSGSAQVSFQRLISFEGERTISETFLDETGQVASSLPSVVTSAGGYDVITLGTGVAVSTKLRVGATINRWFNGYHQTLDRDTVRGGIPGHTTQEFDYDFSGWNLNLGLVWSPYADFNLGLVYKSAFAADVQLNKNRTDLTVPSTSNQASSTDPGMSPITIDFPAAIGIGASWRPRSRVTVSADYTRSFWSKGEIRNFFSLPQARPLPGTPTTYPLLPYPSLDPSQPQHDTVQVRGGVEFVFIFGRVKLPVRAGAFSDRQYVEAIDGTPPHFTGLTAGTGVVIGPVLVDVAFIRERGKYQAVGTTTAGTAVSVKSRRLVGSVIFRFPRH